jgi:hypothetical protein
VRPSRERELPPPVEAKAGRSAYACRINIRVKTKLDSQKEDYGACLTTLFSADVGHFSDNFRGEVGALQESAGGNCDDGR